MKKITHVYKGVNDWIDRPPGIGQFIRGSCYLHEILQSRQVDFKIDISSSKLSQLIFEDDDIFSKKKYDNKIKAKEYFAADIKNHGCLVEDLNRFLLSDNIDLYLSTNVGSWDRVSVPSTTKDFIRKFFNFREAIEKKFNKNVAPEGYEVLSIRCGYPQHSELSNLDSREQITLTTRMIEENILHQAEHPIFVSSDSYEIKKTLAKRYGFLALPHNSKHDGFSDAAESLAMDMLLIKHSKFNYHINLYAEKWSAFSHYISIIHDIPNSYFRLPNFTEETIPDSIRVHKFQSDALIAMPPPLKKANTTSNKIVLPERAKIAVIKPDGIGDLVLITPLLRSLRIRHPLAIIVLITADHSLNITGQCPYIDWQIGGMSILTPTDSVVAIADILKKRYGNFDLSILARWDTDWYGGAAMSVRLGATCRLAFSESCTELKSDKNKGFDPFFTHLIFKKSVTHEVENTFEICKYLDLEIEDRRTEIWPAIDDREKVRNLLLSRGIASNFAVVCLGASGSVRRLDVKTWAKVVDALIEESKLPIVILGGADCMEVADQLCSMVKVHNFSGKTNLIESGLFMQAARFSICLDSSMKHIGAALGSKLIQVVAHSASLPEANSASQTRFGPWGGVCKTLYPTRMEDSCRDGFCKGSEPHCIRNIDFASMRIAIQEFMNG